MRPKLQLLDKALIERILGEAFELIENPGVRVAPYVVELLLAAGIPVRDGVAHIPEAVARRALESAPVVRELTAPVTGTIAHLGAIRVGTTALHLGAGRVRKDDTIDHARRLRAKWLAEGKPIGERFDDLVREVARRGDRTRT